MFEYVKNMLIGTKNVTNTNYCDISVCQTNDKTVGNIVSYR